MKIISNQPSEEWMNPSFNDQQWESGKAPFDNGKTRAKTLWLSKDLWVKRIFNPDATEFNKLILNCNMMITSKVYINRLQSAIAMLIYQCN